MKTEITQNHFNDAHDRPEGGQTFGQGFAIAWQRGPLGRDEQRIPANGAFVEDIIQAAIGRLEFYQASEFSCQENAAALDHLYSAAHVLDQRTKAREARGVEGTHKV